LDQAILIKEGGSVLLASGDIVVSSFDRFRGRQKALLRCKAPRFLRAN
jgi:hypothetical protein